MRINNKENIEAFVDQLYELPEKTLMVIYRAGCAHPNIDNFDPLVKAVIENKLLARIGEATDRLQQTSDKTVAQVKLLTASSDRLETLTRKLNHLTWVLVGLTVVAVLTPIGVEGWKANHHELQDVKVVAPLPPSAPQTPAHPNH